MLHDRGMDEIASAFDFTSIHDLRRLGVDDRAFRRVATRGVMVQLHRGAYMDRADWAARDPDGRYVMRVIGAVASSRSRLVASHESAAAIWAIPRIAALPARIHVLSSTATGTRTEGMMRRHATTRLDFDIQSRGELRVTGLIRTLVELATVVPFVDAVAAFDWALHRQKNDGAAVVVTRESVIRWLSELGIPRFRKRVLMAFDFADADAGSPGESISRVVIHELGFPKPELQHPFFDSGGLIGISDFWWPEHNTAGEFDGVAKYVREEFTKGRSTAQVVIDEKNRENRIRATGPRVARWDWRDVTHPALLHAILVSAGLPFARSTRRRA